ncbi:minor capsid protein [Brevibacillus laterosporus]|uniref:phage minor capsid protein n=1 Tax=Brevibacillus laterosporus TaxID=1465 RepID=UPI000C791C6A|nr:phage minor capsid protein [Brevibacillus laterosporus]AUM66382.1 minor capsid protein [Brevibacillus laterosporus]
MNGPQTQYDYDIERLVTAYKRALNDIMRELERLNVTDVSYTREKALVAKITQILTELNEETTEWINVSITKAVEYGVAESLVALESVGTVSEALALAKFGTLNKRLVASAIADTQSDLLEVTKRVHREVRLAIRRATAEAMRANMARGTNGRRTISRDILSDIRKTLGRSVETGIIDAAGRRWKPEVYVDTVVRTKMMRTQIEATINEAVERETYYGRISGHGAKDACRSWEGRIVKLMPDAPGDYPYIGNLIGSREIFHPRCRHVVTPIRLPEK